MSSALPEPAPAEDADVVAALALAVDGVTGLHTGTFGEVATYLPGRRVEGVRLRDDSAEVHVVVRAGADVLAVADDVRARVSAVVTGDVDVYIEDIDASTTSTASAPGHDVGRGVG